MLQIRAISTALIIVCSSASAAEPDAFYTGAEIGRTHVSDVSQGDTSFGIFAGYNFSENVAAEIGFRRLADFEYRTNSYRERVHVDRLSLSVIGSISLGDPISAYGRLGINSSEVGGRSDRFGGRDAGIKPLYGLGIKYSFHSGLSGRVEVQKSAHESTGLSVGIFIQF